MRKWWPLVAVCLGAFMLLVDVTIVTVALPDMAGDLKASFSELQWVMDVYALALAALLLGAGSLADLLGRRRVYVAGLLFFALASLACGLAPNAATLIAARAAQGLGGAAMFATTMALLNSTYRGRDRGMAFGVWGAVNGAAAAAGPILGGLLTEHLDWRAIFLVNLPVSVITVVLTLAVVAESRRADGARPDPWGMLFFTAAAGALTYGLIEAGDRGFTAGRTLLAFAVAACASVAFVVVENRRPQPMLDLALFRRPSFVAVMLAGALLMASAFAILAYTSVWLQQVLGLGPVRAGAALVPMAAAAFVSSGLSGRFLANVAPRLPIGVGLLLVAAGSAAQAVLDASSDAWAVLPGLVVGGIGVGVSIPVLSSAVMASVPAERGGMAAGALNTFRQLGYALGVAVLGLVFRDGVEGHPAGGPRAAYATALDHAYLVAAGFGVVGGLLVLALVRETAPAEVRAPASAH
ncbi:MFS transporter [Virgisporangium aliadipatigenens]|uniref:MFS transporter n=1 Tax=Virgisporangium aliadipatigenens TaxID=741659 RepID=A0A8J4DP60_9ACTN|nr:MFS transporter [Virgisporangium aliadipatigenens]GIJ44293.1 MFS transporter [Virgisporangium aliadipatigenens]